MRYHGAMSETIVIYHGGCPDGFTAAWAFRRLRPDVPAVFHPGRFGVPPPDVRGKDVYVFDFSYPRETLSRMAAEARSLLVLDHHKTARADLEGLPYCVFDMERSGAGLTWDHLAATIAPAKPEPRPWLVEVVEDRDLWRFRLGDRTRAVSAYLATLPMTFEAWDELQSSGPEEAEAKGASIQAYIDSYGEKACEHAVFRPLGGHLVPCINVFYENCSDHLARLCRLYPQHPFAASFFLGREGRWLFSLRSVGEFDVSAIARGYGGGGHRNAAGFDVPDLPWDESAAPKVKR